MSCTIRTIIGRRGEGKTTLAEKFVLYRSQPVIIIDPLSQFKGLRFFNVRQLLDHAIKHQFSISRPLIATIYEMDEFALICKIALGHRNLMLVVDEVDLFDSPQFQDSYFKKIIHLGRHYNIDLVTTSRRPANISRDLTSQTSEFYIFNITEKRDLDYFSFINSDLPEKIKQLPKFHHIKYNHRDIITFDSNSNAMPETPIIGDTEVLPESN